MALLRRRYNLRKRNHRGCTEGTIGKKRIPEPQQCRHKIGRNPKTTKKPQTCPRPRRRQTGLAQMKKQQLAHEYEIERKKRALACREQAVARMERAIARRERAMGLWEKTYSPTTVVNKTEKATAPSKRRPGRRSKNAEPSPPDPEVEIIHHYHCGNPKSVAAIVDLTATSETMSGDIDTSGHHGADRQSREPRSRAKADSVSLRIMNALGRRWATGQKPSPAKVKPPSNTMFSGQGSSVCWQPSMFSMDTSEQWPPLRSHRRPMPSDEQGVKTESIQSPATY